MDPNLSDQSPTWGTNIKLIAGLSLVALFAGILIRFRAFIPPLILTFILIYLLQPLVERFSKLTRLSWRWSVNIIFIILIIVSLSALTLTGVAVVQQFQSIINVIERFINELPEIVSNFSSQVYMIGPFRFDLSRYLDSTNIESSLQQLLDLVQPVLGHAGGLLGTIASGTATTIGWGFLILILSYFILADIGQVSDPLVHIELPGYDTDVRRILRELSRIWDAFLRGQVIMFTLAVIIYTILFSILGVRYVFALALVSGLARFVPYIGQWVNWAVLLLVLIFQKSNYLGLESVNYIILVVAIVFIIDQILDNIISPRIMGQSIGVHPAAVLLAALIGFSLLGIVGVIIAAPGLASITMLGRYVIRKMLDLDPWPDAEAIKPGSRYPWSKLFTWVKAGIDKLRKWINER